MKANVREKRRRGKDEQKGDECLGGSRKVTEGRKEGMKREEQQQKMNRRRKGQIKKMKRR